MEWDPRASKTPEARWFKTRLLLEWGVGYGFSEVSRVVACASGCAWIGF